MQNKPAYTSIVSSRAPKEIILSFDWYEERQISLGDRFVEQGLLKIHNIEQNPELFSCRYRSYREALIPVFPVLIIYRVNKRKRSVRIVSVFHTSRNYMQKYR